MLNSLKNNLHWLLYILGICVYIPIIADGNISLGVVWLIFALYGWLIIAMIQQQYIMKEFLYAICIAGIIIAISMFFIQGLEELPFPKGAIIFHLDGLAQALAVFFVFTIPLIIYNYSNINSEQKKLKPNKQNNPQNTQKKAAPYNEEKWEEATIEDLESGTFEVI